MKKIILMLTLISVISLFVGTTNIYAADAGLNGIISGMKNASTISEADAGTGIATTINNIIGLLQLAGTGISVIVMTMLGIKYLIASPSEKADTKKMIMPILLGCILLFGAVNLVAVVADFSAVLDTESGAGA
ncbi:MAG: TrbC/VirB2 family protein [Clostridia bacterium]|nr:TrbC/VirB2 family protein [Clostridia bacterium]